MRSILAPLFFVTACVSAPPDQSSAPTTVRDRLARPTRLTVSAAASSGTITARRYTHDGWQVADVAVPIANGELVATASAAGELELATLIVDAAPIDIPSSVFGTPAQLRDVVLVLAAKPAVTTSWTDADDATATAMVDLDLMWTLFVNGGATPLGTQHLPPIAVDLALAGSGDHVDASIDLHATGELWSWAGLIQLADLKLTLVASTEP